MWPFKKKITAIKPTKETATKPEGWYEGYKYFIVEDGYDIYIERHSWWWDEYFKSWELSKSKLNIDGKDAGYDTSYKVELYNTKKAAENKLKKTGCFKKHGVIIKTEYP